VEVEPVGPVSKTGSTSSRSGLHFAL
jgi:hypothetical protein